MTTNDEAGRIMISRNRASMPSRCMVYVAAAATWVVALSGRNAHAANDGVQPFREGQQQHQQQQELPLIFTNSLRNGARSSRHRREKIVALDNLYQPGNKNDIAVSHLGQGEFGSGQTLLVPMTSSSSSALSSSAFLKEQTRARLEELDMWTRLLQEDKDASMSMGPTPTPPTPTPPTPTTPAPAVAPPPPTATTKAPVTVPGTTAAPVAVTTTPIPTPAPFLIPSLPPGAGRPTEPPVPLPVPPPTTGTVVDIISTEPDLSTFEQAIVAVNETQGLSRHMWTIFAPTDFAFRQVDPAFLTKLFNNNNWALHLDQLISVHTVRNSVYLAANLTQNLTLTMHNHDLVMVDLSTGAVLLSGEYFTDSQVTSADLLASNGVVHKVNKVFTPSALAFNLTGRINDIGNLQSLAALISMAGLGATLAASDYTVLAPSDDALDALPASALDYLVDPANVDVLTEILLYHVLDDSRPQFSFASGDQVPTVNGATVSVVNFMNGTADAFSFNGINVTKPDILASNGVIHILDGVLIPPGVVLPDSGGPTPSPAMGGPPTAAITQSPVGMDTDTDGPTAAPVAGGGITLTLPQLAFAFVSSRANREPTAAEYDQMASNSANFYLQSLRSSYNGTAYTLGSIHVEFVSGRYDAGIPEPRFNIYAILQFHATFTSPTAPSIQSVLDGIAGADLVDYIVHYLRVLQGTPFESTTEVAVALASAMMGVPTAVPVSAPVVAPTTPSGSSMTPTFIVAVPELYLAYNAPNQGEPTADEYSQVLELTQAFYLTSLQGYYSGTDFALTGLRLEIDETKFGSGIPADKYNIYIACTFFPSFSSPMRPSTQDFLNALAAADLTIYISSIRTLTGTPFAAVIEVVAGLV